VSSKPPAPERSPEPRAASPSSPDRPAVVDQPGANTQHYRDVLRELVDIGTDIARMFLAHARLQHQFVDAGAHPHAPIDFSIPYESLARSIRRTIALAQKLDQPAPPIPAARAEQARTASRLKIIREVEDAIERHAADTPPEDLREELRTRLDAPDLEEEIETRPIADIIAEICHDLGLDHAPGSPPWKRRTPADIARLYAIASQSAKNPPQLRTYTADDPLTIQQKRKQFFFEKKNQKTFMTQGSS